MTKPSSRHDLGQIDKKLDALHDIIRILWREQMSKTADLTTAVNGLKTAVEALVAAAQAGSANSTPDTDVQAQIDAIDALTAEVNAANTPPA